MVYTMKFLAGPIGLLLALGSTSPLDPLVIEGQALCPTLDTVKLDERPIRHVPSALIPTNPHRSTDREFVQAIARSGSQGRLDGSGVQSALYALFASERDLGIYGLEAASVAEADRLELSLRNIWAHNVSLDRAQVHREGLVLVVIWTDGVTPECWEAVNASVVDRLQPTRPGP